MNDYAFAEILDGVARRATTRPAVIWRGRAVTFEAFAERTARLAGVLRQAGLGDVRPRQARWESGQDHVAVYMRNRPEWLEALLGCCKARCVAFNVNYRYVAEEVRDLFDIARPRAVVYEAAFAPAVGALGDLLHNVLLVQVADESGHALVPGAVDYEEAVAATAPASASGWSGDDRYAVFTGGTTGVPKAVLWRQADLFAAALGGLDPATGRPWASLDDVLARMAHEPRPTLPVPPFMHATAQWNALAALLQGDTVVIQDVVDRLDPHDVWRTAERHGVKMLAIVGNAFARPLVEALGERRYDVTSLRVIVSSGVALGADVKRDLFRLLPEVTILDTAGSSEGGAQMVQRVRAGDDVHAGVFAPAAGTVVLSADRTRVLTPDDDEVGWLARHGPVPLAYLHDPGRTAETFPEVDGMRFAVPGDRARRTASGEIVLLGRDSVTVNSGGEKIFAEEVEDAIGSNPAVLDVVVVGRPSERWGHEVVAIVQLRPGAVVTDDDLLAEAGRRLARYKLPKAFVYVDAMPRNPAGKVDRRWAESVGAKAAQAS